MSRPIPPHGTPARRRGNTSRPPCKCDPCQRAGRRADKEGWVRRSRGISGEVPVTTASEHVRMLIDSGRTITGIAEETGLDWDTVQRVLNRTRDSILRSTSEKLLTVKPLPDDEALTDSTGTVRRVRALIAVGHSQQTLSDEVGCAFTYVTSLAYGRRPTVTMALARSVKQAYDKLSMTMGSSVRGRLKARRLGWHGPLAWDDDTIDNPAAIPHPLVDHAGFWSEAEKPLHEADVDQVVVSRFVKGFKLERFTDAEFLTAVQQCAADGMNCSDIDDLRGWVKKTTENQVNRIRKQYERAGWAFPDLGLTKAPAFTEQQVVDMRERSAAGTPDVQLAVAFDVSRETIRSIVRGQRYAQYGGPIRKTRSKKSLQASREYMCGHASNSLAASRKNEMEKAA